VLAVNDAYRVQMNIASNCAVFALSCCLCRRHCTVYSVLCTVLYSGGLATRVNCTELILPCVHASQLQNVCCISQKPVVKLI